MLAAMQVVAGPAWRWVDANGTVHYSDRPVPGAEEVYLPDASPAPPRPSTTAPSGPRAAATANGDSDDGAATAYTRLAITSPAADETLWNLGGELNVSVAVAPALQQGHGITLYYDGAPVNATPATGSSFTVTEVYRGSHTVHAEIVDARNMPLMRSVPVQFFVQQTSIQNRAR